jgi:hypothetical protein
MAEKERTQQAKSEMKNEIPHQYRLEKSFEEITKLIPKKIEEAKKTGSWKEVRLWEYGGYILEIAITPNGVPMLRLASPSLRNNLVIPNAEVYRVVVELAKTLEYNYEVIMNLIGLCNRYNARTRVSKRDIV